VRRKKGASTKATKNKAVARTANLQAEQNVVKIKDSGLRRNNKTIKPVIDRGRLASLLKSPERAKANSPGHRPG
jgi:hypothetical protein